MTSWVVPLVLAQVFQPGPPLSLPRLEGPVQMLADGRVVTCGGVVGQMTVALPDGGQRSILLSTDTCEVLEPRRGRWVSGPRAPYAFAFTSMVRLLDGRLMVVDTGNPETFFFLRDGGVTSARGPTPVDELAMVVTASGEVLAIGGQPSGSAVGTVQRYSPATDTWVRDAGLLATGRRRASATRVDDQVFVFGGAAPADFEVLNATGARTSGGTLLAGRTDAESVLLLDGRVLVLGSGASTELVPLDGGPSVPGPAFPSSLGAGSGAVRLVDGRVLVFGGSGAFNGRAAFSFEPSSSTLTRLTDLPQTRTAPTPVLLPGGDVLLMNGGAGALPTPGTQLVSVTPLSSSAPVALPFTVRRAAALRLSPDEVLVVAVDAAGVTRWLLVGRSLAVASQGLVPGFPGLVDALVSLPDGRAFLLGGGQTAIFHRPSRSWARTSTVPASPTGVHLARVGRELLLVGTVNGVFLGAFGYDPDGDAWRVVSTSMAFAPRIVAAPRSAVTANELVVLNENGGSVFGVGASGTSPTIDGLTFPGPLVGAVARLDGTVTLAFAGDGGAWTFSHLRLGDGGALELTAGTALALGDEGRAVTTPFDEVVWASRSGPVDGGVTLSRWVDPTPMTVGLGATRAMAPWFDGTALVVTADAVVTSGRSRVADTPASPRLLGAQVTGPRSLRLFGTRLRGFGTSTGDGPYAAAMDFPFVVLTLREGDVLPTQTTAWRDVFVDLELAVEPPAGPAMVTVVVAGHASEPLEVWFGDPPGKVCSSGATCASARCDCGVCQYLAAGHDGGLRLCPPADAGVDAGTVDAGAGGVDGGEPDAGPVDAGPGAPDASLPMDGGPDAPDASLPTDAGLEVDAGLEPVPGAPSEPFAVGCSCSQSDLASVGCLVAVGLWLRRRSTRRSVAE
ncbi:MAG: kelch repeat-containing protein [Myxococcaceae bacterium]|nr:kelch repeat-containing protein [Myxococcaceae bacterium]